MSESTMAKRRLDAVADAHALADTLAQWPAGNTISPQTLAQTGISIGRAMVNEPTATANLPRIAIEHQVAGPLPPDSVERADFEVRGVLGEGGMGRIWLARQHSLGRDVAIKTLKDSDDSATFVAAILHEGRITGALEHPGIVPVHALGVDNSGMPLLVMKRIEGMSFRALLQDPSHRAWETIAPGVTSRLEASIEIIMRVCQSLAFAHSRRILHRDIKPENILIGDYGETYLCDWGVATRIEEVNSSAGTLVGTPNYMAPEMLLGEAIDDRTDVYLLGATLHTVLTGSPRHDGRSMQEIFDSIAHSTPFEYDASVPVELGDLCNRATSFDPAGRPESAGAFRKELGEYLHRRSAMVLCSAALERLDALEKMLEAAPTNSIPQDLSAAYRHATEARFGFIQSLRVHEGLDGAKAGLERALIAMCDLELRQQHAQTAATLLEELKDPPQGLVDRLAEVRRLIAAKERETERLKAIARDFDPEVAVRSRLAVLGAMSACGVVVAAGIFLKGDPDHITPADSVKFAATMLGSICVVVVLMRHRLRETLFNRRMAGFFVSTMAVMLMHRIISLHTGDTMQQILLMDTQLLLAMVIACVVTFEKRAFGVALVLGVSLVAMILRPEHSSRIFQATTVLMVPALLTVWKMPHEEQSAKKNPTKLDAS